MFKNQQQFLLYFTACFIPLLTVSVLIVIYKIVVWFRALIDYIQGNIPDDTMIEPTIYLSRFERRIREKMKYKGVEIKTRKNRNGDTIYFTVPAVSRRKFFPSLEQVKAAINRWERAQRIKDKR